MPCSRREPTSVLRGGLVDRFGVPDFSAPNHTLSTRYTLSVLRCLPPPPRNKTKRQDGASARQPASASPPRRPPPPGHHGAPDLPTARRRSAGGHPAAASDRQRPEPAAGQHLAAGSRQHGDQLSSKLLQATVRQHTVRCRRSDTIRPRARPSMRGAPPHAHTARAQPAAQTSGTLGARPPWLWLAGAG